VTAVTVQGVTANNIGSGVWRAILTGTVTVASTDVVLTVTQPAAVNDIDTTKTVATKGFFGDVYYQVFLLNGVTTSSVKSVAVTDSTGTTVLPYNTTNGDYEKDITYASTLPTTASVVLTTTSAGVQTVSVTPK